MLPAAGDPDVLLLGGLAAFALEGPVTTLQAGGFTDAVRTSEGSAAYSASSGGTVGQEDYALASGSRPRASRAQPTGI